MLFLLATLLSLGFQEARYPEWKQTFSVEEMIHQESNEKGEIVIFRNRRFGKIVAIDGMIHLAENDVFIYHEMMAHVPLLAHGEAKSVLILGGGDGGLLKEVLRHPNIERVVVAESDPTKIVLSKKFFPELFSSAFEDPKSTILIQEESRFIKETEETFDLILFDTKSSHELPPEFYSDCKAILKPNGILVHPNGIPFLEKERLVSTYENGKAHFKHVQFYIAPVPTSIGGFMAFAFASDRKYKPAAKLLTERLEKLKGEMRYYNPAIHRASFSLPQSLICK